MFLRKLVCSLGCLVFLSLPAGAQNPPAAGGEAPGTILARGAVRTARGYSIPGATLRLTELASGRAWVTWTDENGKFELPGLPPGRYRVEAEQIGFESAAKEIEFIAQGPAIELTLPVAALAALDHPAQPQAPENGNPVGASPAQKAETPKSAPAGANPADPGAPGGPSAANAPPGPPGARKPGQAPANVAEMIRQRMRQGGFQDVDMSAQGAGQDTVAPADAGPGGPLGEASSSDAFLINGTVGRGATQSDAGFGPFGALGPFGGMAGPGGFPAPGGSPGPGGFPGQPGGAGDLNIMVMGQPNRPGGGRGGQGGPGQGRQGQQGQKPSPTGSQGSREKGGQRAGFGEGTEGLWGAYRILRQQVNRIRVSFYDRYGNSALDARPYSLTEANPRKVATWRERFGGNVGGPLRIPRVYDGREKTFFFVNYNLARARDPVDTFAAVPTLAERMGDFSARGVSLFDPVTRAPLGSVIPPARPLDQAALGLLRFIPPPNVTGVQAYNFHLQTRVPTANDNFNVRMIHTISPKLNAQATYNFNGTRARAFHSFPQLQSNTSARGQSLMLGLTQNWTPRFLHDSRIMWSRNRVQTQNAFAFTENIAAGLGITGVSTDPINFGVPQVTFTNFTDVNDPVPALRRNQTLRYVDTFSYALPKHTYRAGLEIRRMQVNTRTDPTPRGAFNFTGALTSQLDANGKPVRGTGFDFADFLLGLPQSTTARFGTSSTYFRNWGFVGYVHDDWRMHPRFTLSYGLRYEAGTPKTPPFRKR